jgi:predicted SAM-dependent methyltransferase
MAKIKVPNKNGTGWHYETLPPIRRPTRQSLYSGTLCRHLGPPTGNTIECGSCPANKVRLKLHTCSIHEKCTLGPQRASGVVCCQGCPDRSVLVPLPRPVLRHFLFHLYPVHNRWYWHAMMLRQRLYLFNGRKIIAVATGPETDTLTDVKRELGSEFEYIEVRNTPNLREVATHKLLWDRVKDQSGVTLYGHSKGVTRADNSTSPDWASIQYKSCMDYWPVVEGLLNIHPIAGCFKRHNRGWPAESPSSDWHYSGSWYWIRNDILFSKPDWTRIDQFWSGIESWPSLHFKKSEAAVIYGEFYGDGAGLYDHNIMNRMVSEFKTWEKNCVHLRTETPQLVAQGCRKVEIGGGRYSKGEGWINIDGLSIPGVDVVVDFEKCGEIRLPIPDDWCSDIYSSHCLEHIHNVKGLLREMLRISSIGCKWEIRLPWWLSSMAMCYDHKHVLSSPEQIRHWVKDYPDYWFGDLWKNKHLSLESTQLVRGQDYEEARVLFPHLTSEQIMRFIPGTCHEAIYKFEVQKT